jgi:hypothetical protein
MIFVLGLAGVILSFKANRDTDAMRAAFYESRWSSLTDDQISMIVPSVAGTRPAQPMMTIYYLGNDALAD